MLYTNYGKKKLLWFGDKSKTLNYSSKSDEMILTVHRWFANKSCPGTNYARTGKFTGKGVFTITEVKTGTGSKAGWGKLKSGAGWISLDYTSRI